MTRDDDRRDSPRTDDVGAVAAAELLAGGSSTLAIEERRAE